MNESSESRGSGKPKLTQEQMAALVESVPWVRRSTGDWVKRFACPRCGHRTESLFEGGFAADALAYRQIPDVAYEGEAGADFNEFRAECDCGHDHDRADGDPSCGWRGMISGPQA